MLDLDKHITRLLSLPAIPGEEDPVRCYLADTWRPWVDSITTSRLGSLHVEKRGSGAHPRKRVMVTAHMDGVGMMVTALEDGFIRFTQVGGLDPRVLPGQKITVHGKKEISGLIVDPGERLLPEDMREKATPIEYLMIDTGLPAGDVAGLVRVGAPISFASSPVTLGGGWIMGHTLDNRASLAALTVCLEALQTCRHEWDVWLAATVQEETTHAGATTSGYDIHPDLAVVVDTTYGCSPGEKSPLTFPLGGGLTLGIGPNIHPALHTHFKRLAEEQGIPCQIEVLPGNSLTDAHALQVVASGIPCMVLSIPILNMHTPVEVAAVTDIQHTGILVARWIEALGVGIDDPFAFGDTG